MKKKNKQRQTKRKKKVMLARQYERREITKRYHELATHGTYDEWIRYVRENRLEYKDLIQTAIVNNRGSQFITSILNDGLGDIHKRDHFNGETYLHMACYYGSPEDIDLIVALGVDVNAMNDGGGTPIFDAIKSNKPENVRKMIELGADLDVRHCFFSAEIDGVDPFQLAAIVRMNRNVFI